jgi:hypothetical protein
MGSTFDWMFPTTTFINLIITDDSRRKQIRGNDLPTNDHLVELEFDKVYSVEFYFV